MICGSDHCVFCLDIPSASSWGITGVDPEGFPVPQPLKEDLPHLRWGSDLSSESPQDESLTAAFGLPQSHCGIPTAASLVLGSG